MSDKGTQAGANSSNYEEIRKNPMHELKCWPFSFQAIVDGVKAFEVRGDDRGYRAGDYLWLREWDPLTKKYTGADTIKRVTFIMRGGQFGVEVGYCVMSLDAVSYEELSRESRRSVTGSLPGRVCVTDGTE